MFFGGPGEEVVARPTYPEAKTVCMRTPHNSLAFYLPFTDTPKNELWFVLYLFLSLFVFDKRSCFLEPFLD